MHSSSSILSIRVWTSSGSFGVVLAIGAVKNGVEWLVTNADAAGSKAGASAYVLWVENIEFGSIGLIAASDRKLGGS